jgi:TPR repeat protein
MRTRITGSINRIVVAAALVLSLAPGARADSQRTASAAFERGDFVAAAKLLPALAERGNARAQTMLGFLYETGQGVPQAYEAASYWYRRAAEQGDTTAQYLLGLAYNNGHGVPRDEVAAYKWLDLAAAHAPKRMREQFARLRNAVASKMSHDQIATAQWYALRWPTASDF